MHINDIFTQALPLPKPWIISSSELRPDKGVLILEVEVPLKTRMPCACGKECGVHDRKNKSWRHLNFWQYETIINAKVPRTKCDNCGVKLVDVPWARPGSGFTLLFEALILVLCKEMSVAACAQLVGEFDTRLWRIIKHYVAKARDKQDWSELENIGVDETSRKKGHTYVTNFVDTVTGNLLLMTEGKSADTFDRFIEELEKYGGTPDHIKEVAMDMSPAFRSGAAKCLPDASIVYDRFHVMQMVGAALEDVRKQVNREAGGLGKGAMWALRGNEVNLKQSQIDLRKSLCKEYKVLGRAMALREFFQEMWKYTSEELAREHFERWYSWARRCRLEPFKILAGRLRNHLEGIMAYYENQTTSAIIESLNGKLQLARRRAMGFRNVENFKAIAYWIAGGIEPGVELPNPLSMPKF